MAVQAASAVLVPPFVAAGGHTRPCRVAVQAEEVGTNTVPPFVAAVEDEVAADLVLVPSDTVSDLGPVIRHVVNVCYAIISSTSSIFML